MDSIETRHQRGAAERLSPIEKILDSVTSKALGGSNTRSVYAEPIRQDQRTIIPVARISQRYGFGGGSGSSESPDDSPASGGGGGGGTLNARPVGYIEVTGDGSRFVPIIDWSQILLTAVTMSAVSAVVAVLRRNQSGTSSKRQ